jgi:hypothetical protein
MSWCHFIFGVILKRISRGGAAVAQRLRKEKINRKERKDPGVGPQPGKITLA